MIKEGKNGCTCNIYGSDKKRIIGGSKGSEQLFEKNTKNLNRNSESLLFTHADRVNYNHSQTLTVIYSDTYFNI